MTRFADEKGAEAGPGRIRCLLAPNPSPMTGPGTNTFLLGEGEVAVIDPGPDDPAHLRAILGALGPGERIAAILVTHPHLDHSALVPALARETGAGVFGFGPAGSGRSARLRALAAGDPGSGEGADSGFRPDRRLSGGEVLALPGMALRVVATPGHMAEHLAFGWGEVLFVGDLVMAWAPSLIAPPDGDMGDYLASLAHVAAGPWRRLLPAHGAPVEAPRIRIAELVAHRHAREAQVLAALAAGPATPDGIAARVYPDIAPALRAAARRSAFAHLVDLAGRGIVEADPRPALHATFRLRGA